MCNSKRFNYTILHYTLLKRWFYSHFLYSTVCRFKYVYLGSLTLDPKFAYLCAYLHNSYWPTFSYFVYFLLDLTVQCYTQQHIHNSHWSIFQHFPNSHWSMIHHFPNSHWSTAKYFHNGFIPSFHISWA